MHGLRRRNPPVPAAGRARGLPLPRLLHTVLLTFRQGVELSAALSLTGRELAVTVVLSPLVYLLLRSVHNRILR